METNEEIPRTRSNLVSKPRKLPEIPKDQVPYDITKPPRKPPRQVLRQRKSLSPDLRSRKSSLHKRSSSLTESRQLSVRFGGNFELQERRGTDKSRRQRSSSLCDLHGQDHRCGDQNNSATSDTNRTLPITVYSKDGILSRRCHTCYQRIFTESEECLIAQSQLFHTSCFCCAICDNILNATNYCYLIDHEKFYCFHHYQEVSRAEEELGNVQKNMTGVGPGAFSGCFFANDCCRNRQQKRKQMLQKLIVLQHRRTMLEEVRLSLENTLRRTDREEKLFVWQHWFDVTFEKTIITKEVTELAYQIKESELYEEQEQLERRLRRLKNRRDEGTGDENYQQQQEDFLRSILDVIEKRDLLLLELEIERRRDVEEVQKLKSNREKSGKSIPQSHLQNCDKLPGNSPNELTNIVQSKAQCLIL